ncbi:MAG: DMT family transporter [Candidatus Kapaibacterium sp.]
MSFNQTRGRKAEAMLVLVTLIWGGTFATTKSLTQSIDPASLLALRFGIASLAFFLFFFKKLSTSLHGKVWLHGFILGIFLYGGYILQTIGLQSTSSSRSGFITVLYVALTPLLQMILTRKLPRIQIRIGLGLVLLGLWGLTAPGGTISGMIEPWRAGGFGIGDLLTLGGACSFAIYIVLLDRFGSHDVIPLTGVQILTMFTCALVQVIFSGHPTLPAGIAQWGGMLYLSILSGVFGTYWQTRYQRYTTPTRAAAIYTLEAVFAALVGAVLLGEWLGLIGLIGGALIVAGLLIVEWPSGETAIADEI